MKLIQLKDTMAIVFTTEEEATYFLRMFLKTIHGKQVMAQLERQMAKEMR